MNGIVSTWKGFAPSTKRNIALVIGVTVCFVVYRGLKHDSVADSLQEATSAHYVQAGAALCNDQYQAAMQARTGRGVFKDQMNPGCQQVGANIEVNILGQASFNGIDVVQVGNRGGVAWAAADDVH